MNYTQYFVEKTRSDGNKFVACTDDAPECIRDLIREIHFSFFDGCLPNDWIYKIIVEAFEELEENDLDDVYPESDCYYWELKKWFLEPFADKYVEEAMELGLTRIYEVIGLAQTNAKQNIYYAVNEFLEQQRESADVDKNVPSINQ